MDVFKDTGIFGDMFMDLLAIVKSSFTDCGYKLTTFKEHKLSSEKRFYLVLKWLRVYPSLLQLANEFDIDKSLSPKTNLKIKFLQLKILLASRLEYFEK